jgi:hypothetical protein
VVEVREQVPTPPLVLRALQTPVVVVVGLRMQVLKAMVVLVVRVLLSSVTPTHTRLLHLLLVIQYTQILAEI